MQRNMVRWMPSKSSSTCKKKRHANTTKCFAVPIVQWTSNWMACQSVCSFANEDARETGMGCWPQTFLLASLKRIVFMPDDGLPKLHTRIARPCWTLANASLYILPLKLPASLWQWCSITSLCTVKRFEAYETIGGLFAEVTNDTLELSVTDKIWAIILDFILEAAERYSIDATEFLADFIESNPVAHTLRNMYIYKQASWYLFTCESLVNKKCPERAKASYRKLLPLQGDLFAL